MGRWERTRVGKLDLTIGMKEERNRLRQWHSKRGVQVTVDQTYVIQGEINREKTINMHLILRDIETGKTADYYWNDRLKKWRIGMGNRCGFSRITRREQQSHWYSGDLM